MDDRSNLNSQPQSKPRLRWYQFSLRSMLIFVTLLAAIFAVVLPKLKELLRHRDGILDRLNPPLTPLSSGSLGRDTIHPYDFEKGSSGVGKPLDGEAK